MGRLFREFRPKASWTLMSVVTLMWVAVAYGDDPRVDFSRDIRPILSNTCFTCHGPDEAQRTTDFRLDNKEGAFEALAEDEYAIVPGDSAKSILYQRITSEDEFERMPPVDSEKSLKPAEIALIKTWIEQGAEWRDHWSFVAPQRPTVPAVQHESGARNTIDRFLLERLEQEDLEPSSPADKRTLIRRVTLDLTGLPPTINEVDAFVADESPTAYANLVERLLESPRYGEHMARYWLDAARYGDTHGLHFDNERSMTPYREWVISAFNHNMPFDQFTVEQLAGDLLPKPTLDQLVATGFNRCNVTTNEGGTIPEEYRVRYAIDRVETAGTVWLGLTIGCAVCHDHKYDPIKQKEFYSLFAYYNNVADDPLDGNALGPAPIIQVPAPLQEERMSELQAKIAEVREVVNGPMPQVDAAQRAWRQNWLNSFESLWQVAEPVEFKSAAGTDLQKLDDNSLRASGEPPETDVYEITVRTDQTGISAFRLDAAGYKTLPDSADSDHDGGFVLSEFEVEAMPADKPDEVHPVELVFAQTELATAGEGTGIEKAIDGKSDPKAGWSFVPGDKHQQATAVFVPAHPLGFPGGTILRFRLRQESELSRRTLGRLRLSFSTEESLAPIVQGPWYLMGSFTAGDEEVAFDKDFGPETGVELDQIFLKKKKWDVKPDFVDGGEHRLIDRDFAASYLYRTIHSPVPRKATLSVGTDDAVKVWWNGEVVLSKNVVRRLMRGEDRIDVELKPGKNELLMKVINNTGESAFQFELLTDDTAGERLKILPLLALNETDRSDEQKQQLRQYYRGHHVPQWQDMRRKLDSLEKNERDLNALIPITMVMDDVEEKKPAHVLMRGEYDQPGEAVEPGIPAVLPPMPADAPANRLGLAQWLVEPSHPLTARVTVNRLWQQFFGTGIVKTTEDFGSQGEWPSHPELLDWLACEFVESGWDVKHIVRLIVDSAAYQQTSIVSPESFAKDPDNRLLSHGPRFRMDAEMIRDLALNISGLMVEELGGKSVKPYQPEGLWEAVGFTTSNTARFVQDEGDDLYRRSLYTFWKRTSPPPSMLTFDAPSRESCVVRRSRTNTPLQALVLMNDVQFVEAARHMARRMMLEGGSRAEDRINFAFQLATSRPPTVDEMRIVLDIFRAHLAEYQQDSNAARKLIQFGDSPTDDSLDVSELAAWTMVANLILNLHETVTKG